MPSFLDRRRMLAGSVILAGSATIALTLAITSPARTMAAPAPHSFLVITVSDPSNGHYPTGSLFTLTATVTNISGEGIGNSQPGVEFFFDSSIVKYKSNGGAWACSVSSSSSSSSPTSTESDDFTCSDGTLTPGGTSTLPVVFTAVGNPGGDPDLGFVVSETGSGTTNVNTSITQSTTDQTDVFPTGSVDNANSYTKDVTSGAFTNKLGVDSIISGTSSGNSSVALANTFTFTDGATRVVLAFPAGAIPTGSHVSIWKANAGFWTAPFAALRQGFVHGYAAGWTASGSSSPSPATATSSITMIVSNASITSTDSLYRATGSGIGTQTGVVSNGAWTVSFVVDPGFVLAQAAVAPTTTSSTTTTIAPPPTGGGGTKGGGAALPIAAGVLLVVVGAVVGGTGRRRRPSPAATED